jgi:hypothetical protein
VYRTFRERLFSKLHAGNGSDRGLVLAGAKRALELLAEEKLRAHPPEGSTDWCVAAWLRERAKELGAAPIESRNPHVRIDDEIPRGLDSRDLRISDRKGGDTTE